jgi:hypothetical protein
MSPWFRRRRDEQPSARATTAEPRPPVSEPEQLEQPEPEPAPDPTGPLTPERLDLALRRLQEESPPLSEDS